MVILTKEDKQNINEGKIDDADNYANEEEEEEEMIRGKMLSWMWTTVVTMKFVMINR